MVLVITNSEDETINYLEKKFRKPLFRFNTDEFIRGYSLNYVGKEFSIVDRGNGAEVNNQNLTGVLYRRPLNPKINLDNTDLDLTDNLSLEARMIYENVISVLECKWMSKPYNIRKAENKVLQLQVAKGIGLNVPEYYLGNNEEKINSFINPKQKYCIKPLFLGPYTNNKKDFIPYEVDPIPWTEYCLF